jgi:hypothetical protein
MCSRSAIMYTTLLPAACRSSAPFHCCLSAAEHKLQRRHERLGHIEEAAVGRRVRVRLHRRCQANCRSRELSGPRDASLPGPGGGTSRPPSGCRTRRVLRRGAMPVEACQAFFCFLRQRFVGPRAVVARVAARAACGKDPRLRTPCTEKWRRGRPQDTGQHAAACAWVLRGHHRGRCTP